MRKEVCQWESCARRSQSRCAPPLAIPCTRLFLLHPIYYLGTFSCGSLPFRNSDPRSPTSSRHSSPRPPPRTVLVFSFIAEKSSARSSRVGSRCYKIPGRYYRETSPQRANTVSCVAGLYAEEGLTGRCKRCMHLWKLRTCTGPREDTGCTYLPGIRHNCCPSMRGGQRFLRLAHEATQEQPRCFSSGTQ